MKTVETNYFIAREKIDLINHLCSDSISEKDFDDNQIAKFSTFETFTVKIVNPKSDKDMEIDLKVCSSDFGEPLWIEAVLLHNGSEVACTSVYDEILGDYILEYDNVRYILHVKESIVDFLGENADRVTVMVLDGDYYNVDYVDTVEEKITCYQYDPECGNEHYEFSFESLEESCNLKFFELTEIK